MRINILNDNSIDISSIILYLENNSISVKLFDDIIKLKSSIAINPPAPLLYALNNTDSISNLAADSILIIINKTFNQTKLLSAMRAGAVDYYSLDQKAGKFDDIISKLKNYTPNNARATEISRHKLEASEQRFKAIAEHTYHSEFWLDIDGNLIFQSPSIERMTGFKDKEFMENSPGFFLDMIHPHDLDGFLQQSKPFLKDLNHPPLIRTFRIITKTGEIRWWESILEHIFDHNRTYIGKRGTSRDITKQILAEEETAKIIAEKELLIKEVHHRVKNNLAIISGILNLQEIYLHDKRDNYVLDILKSRIESMISVHELLYSGKSTDKFNLEELSRTLCMNLIHQSLNNKTEIVFKYNINPVPLDSKLASPIGLIINELVTNCIKYAFPEKNKGRILIGSTIQDDKRTLTIEDDGAGYPKEVINLEKQNLGLVIVSSLANQLGGELKLENHGGSKSSITFPIE